jgi:simple sugar transport system permease protein
MSWTEVLGTGALVPLLVATVRLAIPTMLAAVGECFCERSGVLNLGLEGMMLTGALAAFLGSYYTGSPVVGAVSGAAAGAVLAAVFAVFVIRAKVDQVVAGISLVLFAQGLTSFVYLKLFGSALEPPSVEGAPPAALPLLSDIPVVGRVLFQQSLLVYGAVVLVAVLSWVLFRTRLGLSVRAVGESPQAGEAAGIAVDRVRWIALIVSGTMAGLGGAVLISQLNFFRENVTAGRGWVAIAIVILVRWNPIGAVAGSLLFGFTDALQFRIQATAGGVETGVPYEIFQAMPYIVTLVVVVLSRVYFKTSAEPHALGVPYEKGAA